jgi:hypothetical protein
MTATMIGVFVVLAGTAALHERRRH